MVQIVKGLREDLANNKYIENETRYLFEVMERSRDIRIKKQIVKRIYGLT